MFLFLSILGYDIVWLGIIALYDVFTNPWFGLIVGLMVSMVTMILALLILVKIYKLMKMIDKKSSQTSTYKNMQAAALMCLLEGFIGVLINLPSIYMNVFVLTVSIKRIHIACFTEREKRALGWNISYIQDLPYR